MNPAPQVSDQSMNLVTNISLKFAGKETQYRVIKQEDLPNNAFFFSFRCSKNATIPGVGDIWDS